MNYAIITLVIRFQLLSKNKVLLIFSNNHLWLKEGFATYFGYIILAKIAPAVFEIYSETVI